jgi:hypothetical protein
MAGGATFVFHEGGAPPSGVHQIDLVSRDKPWEAELRRRRVTTWCAAVASSAEQIDGLRSLLKANGEPVFLGAVQDDAQVHPALVAISIRRKVAWAISSAYPGATVVWGSLGVTPEVLSGPAPPVTVSGIHLHVESMPDFPRDLWGFLPSMAYHQTATSVQRARAREQNAALVAKIPAMLEKMAADGTLSTAIAERARRESVPTPEEPLQIELRVREWSATVTVRGPSGLCSETTCSYRTFSRVADVSLAHLAHHVAIVVLAAWFNAPRSGRTPVPPGLRPCGVCGKYRGMVKTKYFVDGLLADDPQAEITCKCDCDRYRDCPTCGKNRVSRSGYAWEFDLASETLRDVRWLGDQDCSACRPSKKQIPAKDGECVLGGVLRALKRAIRSR